jgi:hypothetical protein
MGGAAGFGTVAPVTGQAASGIPASTAPMAGMAGMVGMGATTTAGPGMVATITAVAGTVVRGMAAIMEHGMVAAITDAEPASSALTARPKPWRHSGR